VPSEPANEYRIAVSMTAGPFAVVDKAESTLHRDDLVPPKPRERVEGKVEEKADDEDEDSK
jgi:hypothetical protein